MNSKARRDDSPAARQAIVSPATREAGDQKAKKTCEKLIKSVFLAAVVNSN